MDVSGQTAIVTGGASGLGEATARALAQAGARVGILDTNEELAGRVAAQLDGVAVVCDVADSASHEALTLQCAGGWVRRASWLLPAPASLRVPR